MTELPRSRLTTGTLIAYMAGLVLVGFPLVWYLWSTLNDILSGRFDTGRILIAVPVLAAFIALLMVLARLVRRWDASAVG